MSSLLYTHSIGGNGVGQGLPLRRASQLYDVEPARRYPLVFSTGTDSDMHTYDRGIYRRVPHLPITFIIEPYINNHKAGGGNFTRRQYFVIKRGQPLMAATKRDALIGMFASNGTYTSQTFVDPNKLERNKLTGFTNGTTVIMTEGTNTIRVSLAVFAALPLISVADTTALGALALADLTAADADADSDANADGFTVFVDADGKVYTYDYDAIAGVEAEGANLAGYWIVGAVADVAAAQDDLTVEDEVYTVEEFDALSAGDKAGFRGVYSNLTDTNSKIATGGVNRYAEFDSAIFGSTSLIKYVEIDADQYYFGGATRSEGFIFPSTGGNPRTIFFNEIDQEAAVTLPTSGNGATPRIVTPIGNVTDVATSNGANWYNSAVYVPALPTIGVAHTDLEQALSHKWHMFSTGTEPHSPAKKGRLLLPFLDIVKFKSVMAASAPDETFAVTDETNNRSGLKVGLFGITAVNSINKASLLTSLDAGYANLYYNFGAPFLFTRAFPALRQQIVPDLFGNYVPYMSGALTSSATNAGGNDFGLSDGSRTAQITGTVTANAEHIVGRITNIFDIPGRSLLHLAVNPLFQSRIVDAAERNFTNEGYRRVRGADNAGMEPLLADFLFMLLGGANYSWASGILPKFDGFGQDLAHVIEELVVQGAAGLVEVAVNLVD